MECRVYGDVQSVKNDLKAQKAKSTKLGSANACVDE